MKSLFFNLSLLLLTSCFDDNKKIESISISSRVANRSINVSLDYSKSIFNKIDTAQKLDNLRIILFSDSLSIKTEVYIDYYGNKPLDFDFVQEQRALYLKAMFRTDSVILNELRKIGSAPYYKICSNAKQNHNFSCDYLKRIDDTLFIAITNFYFGNKKDETMKKSITQSVEKIIETIKITVSK